MLPVLIVGGGVQGTAISLALARLFGRDAVRVLDPHAEPLAVWERSCQSCGVEYLRSPAAHSLSGDSFSILGYARERGEAEALLGKYRRPSYELFMHHCWHLIEQYDARGLRLRGRATGMRMIAGGVEVESSAGVLRAQRIILAIGREYNWPHIPSIERAQRGRVGIPIWHIYSGSFRRTDMARYTRPIIIGGGISAVQAALSWVREGHALYPTILCRHPVRIADFDSDPCFLGPRCLRPFSRLSDAHQRIEMMRDRQNRGTVPPETAQALRAAQEAGRCAVSVGEVADIEVNRGGAHDDEGYRGYVLRLKSGAYLHGDCILLATGLNGSVMDHPLYRHLVDEHGLQCSADGLPHIDVALRWHERIMVCGPGAQLVIGAAAGNIIGAQLALRQIVPFLLGDRPRIDSLWRPFPGDYWPTSGQAIGQAGRKIAPR